MCVISQLESFFSRLCLQSPSPLHPRACRVSHSAHDDAGARALGSHSGPSVSPLGTRAGVLLYVPTWQFLSVQSQLMATAPPLLYSLCCWRPRGARPCVPGSVLGQQGRGDSPRPPTPTSGTLNVHSAPACPPAGQAVSGAGPGWRPCRSQDSCLALTHPPCFLNFRRAFVPVYCC